MSTTSQIPRGTRSACSGFTQTELLVAVALMAVGTLVGVGNLADTSDRMRLESGTASIVSELRLARRDATTRNVEVEVFFQDSNKTIVKQGDFDTSGAIDASESLECPVRDAGNLSVTAPSSVGVFSPRGEFSAPESYWRVDVQSPAAGTRYVYVLSSGQIKETDSLLD
jgi:Tfp pilus assembly protein FimT